MANIKNVEFGSAAYEEARRLRDLGLRAPLGLTLTEDDRELDRHHHHFVACEAGPIVGAAILVPPDLDRVAKLRQMVVQAQRRGEGLGTALAQAAEVEARQLGALTLALNARIPAVPFYRRLGYAEQGDPFLEVSIPHIRMIKALD